MKTIRVGKDDWLVLDAAIEPRYLIHHGPAVHQQTGETLMMYRVDHWVLQKEHRWPLGFYERLQTAIDACAAELGMPSFKTPATDQHGNIITTDEQRQRWQAGLDPRTGKPRPDQ